jgi:hypothetical protein
MTTRIVPIVLIVVFTGLMQFGCARPAPGSSEINPIPVRDFLQGGQEPADGYGAYGYILFTARPDSVARPRYLNICRAFMNELPAIGGFATLERQSLVVTYWLMDSLFIVSRRGEVTESLVDHYNYPRAAAMVASLGKYGSRGPLLVAWRTSYHTGIPTSSAIVLDMANFNDEDVANAFRIWRERITSSPEKWRGGFGLQTFLIEFSSLVSKYGQGIFSVIEKFV